MSVESVVGASGLKLDEDLWKLNTGAIEQSWTGCGCKLRGKRRCRKGCEGEPALDHARLWWLPGRGDVVIAHLYGTDDWVHQVCGEYAVREGLEWWVDPDAAWYQGTTAVAYRVAR